MLGNLFRRIFGRGGALALAAMLSVASAGLCDEIWTAAEVDAYADWLRTAAADSLAGSDPAYPHGYVQDGVEDSGVPLLDVAKATIELEGALGRKRMPGEGYEPGMALALARNYRRLAEYDRALGLYRGTLKVLPDSNLAREAFTTAVLQGDSLQVTRELLNIVGASDLQRNAAEVELGYRALLSRGADHDLDLLMMKVDGQDAPMPPRIRFWHAFAQYHLGHDADSLYHLRLLISAPGRPEELPAAAASWVARAIPDLLLQLDRRDDAADLYALLAHDGPAECRPWGGYQLGNILLAGGDYAGAVDCFENIAAEADSTVSEDWLQRVRVLAGVAGDLDRIRNEGEPYGIADLHRR